MARYADPHVHCVLCTSPSKLKCTHLRTQLSHTPLTTCQVDGVNHACLLMQAYYLGLLLAGLLFRPVHACHACNAMHACNACNAMHACNAYAGAMSQAMIENSLLTETSHVNVGILQA
jgi:hypothetical protein